MYCLEELCLGNFQCWKGGKEKEVMGKGFSKNSAMSKRRGGVSQTPGVSCSAVDSCGYG